MTPRSSKRLVSKTRSKRRVSPRKTKVISFKCYAIADMERVHFFGKRAEAVALRDGELRGEGHINTITVASNEDLARILSENVL